MKLVWSERAVGDIIAIADYINEHNPIAAIAIRDRIRFSVERLALFPLSGRPGRASDTRELIISGTPYIAAYRVRNARVEILAIFHASRDPQMRE